MDAIVQKMITEDTNMVRMTHDKQEQSKNDMFQSVMEKKRQ